jgi:chloramphenicol-sensitive protein RarD
MNSAPDGRKGGLFSAIFAFTAWGLLPVYWKALHHVPSVEILCHRIVWSFGFSALLITVFKRWGETRRCIVTPGNFKYFAAGSILIATNWFVYIWAVNSGHVVEASLGYYFNPLVNMLLGFVVFHDRLRRLQWVAVFLAVLGVMNQVMALGRFPWISIFLGVSFGFYGLVRKLMRVESLPGLFFETAILTFPAGSYLIYLGIVGKGALGTVDSISSTLLVSAGAVTSLPLIAFAFSTRRLSLVTVGILQYLSPTSMFLLGVFVYGESFSSAHLVTFACIWMGVAVYVADGLIAHKSR